MKSTPIHEMGEIRVACECCVIFGDKVLLQKRPDDAKNFPGYWTLPGGHIDHGEDALTAVMREIKEETGVTITSENTKLKVSALNYHFPKQQTWLIFGFAARLTRFQANISTEEGETRWFSINKLEKLNIFPPIKYYLNSIIADEPGILFMSAEWQNGELKKLTTEAIDSNC